MVSIIIPCFNGASFINRSLNSILEQTYSDIEVIIVNDGSSDNSEDIILSKKNEFDRLGFRFKYIYQENQGLGAAVNTGLKYVNGKYLTLLDIDDYIMEDSIELKVNFLENNRDYDIVRSNGYYVNEENLEDDTNLFTYNDEEKTKTDIFQDLVEGKINNWAGSYMVRTSKLFEFYKDRNIYESRYGQNLQILLPLAYNGKSGFIDKPLMKYIKQKISGSETGVNIDSKIKNIQGYKDIRVNMIDLILKDTEKYKYNKIIDIMYSRIFIDLAINSKNTDLLDENYKILKKYNEVTIDDRVIYYNTKNKLIGIILRIIRKCSFERKSND